MKSFRIETQAHQMLPITRQVAEAVEASAVVDGICLVYCPHTTAAITINENSDPDVVSDLLFSLEKVGPDRPEYRHFEGNSAAHFKAMLVGESVNVPIHNGKLALGRWQGIYFCEFDGPRSRHFEVQIIKSGNF